jgi:RimJ/RimL family protein N-acetyltransferase
MIEDWATRAREDLVGRTVCLTPLGDEHAADLLAGGGDDAVWRYMPRGPLKDEADARAWIRAARDDARSVAYAILRLPDTSAVGSTRFLDVRPAEGVVEIGWTWLAAAHQRTPVNTEAKYLLLGRAFEELEVAQVEFKTDLRNERSQAALARIGARRGRIVRNHRLGDIVRDSVYYHLDAADWPATRTRLERLLAGGPRRPGAQ